MQAMRSVTISQARRSLTAVIDMSAHGPVVIHRRKQAVAVMLSMAEYERLTLMNKSTFQQFCDAVGERAAAAGMTEDGLAELLRDSNDGSQTPGQPTAPDRPPGDAREWAAAWSDEADRREDCIARGESSWIDGQNAIDRLRSGLA